MRLITGDECGLLKEVIPETGRPKSDDTDDPTTPVKPYHMDLADKVTKLGARRIDPNEQQTRERGVIDLTWMNETNSHTGGNVGDNRLEFAALRRNGSVQVWSANRDDPQKHGRYRTDFTTTNVFSEAWDGSKDRRGCCPLGIGYLPQDHRLCAGDSFGNVVVLDAGGDKQCEIIHTYNTYQNSKRGQKITYTPGSFDNTQMATTMAVHPIQGRVAMGGRERETSLLDLETGQVVWKAKNLPPDPQTLLQQPVWPTAICFLGQDSNTMAVGTAYKEVRLYDIRESTKVRRPTAVTPEGLFEYRVTSLCPLGPANTSCDLVVGDAAGFLYQLDLRKLGKDRKVQAHKDLSRFVGPGGSVRQIQLHPTLPRMAVVGLDRMLRIFDTNTRKQVDCVYLKQRLNSVLFHTDDDWDIAKEITQYESDEAIRSDDEGIDQDDLVQDYVDSDDDDDDMAQGDDLDSDEDNDGHHSDDSEVKEEEESGSSDGSYDDDDNDDQHESKEDAAKLVPDEEDSEDNEKLKSKESNSDDDDDDERSQSSSDSDGHDENEDDDNDNENGTSHSEERAKSSILIDELPPRKKRKEVQVIKCPSAFPISAKTSSKKRQRFNEDQQSNKPTRNDGSGYNGEEFLDWHETVKEVRAYGATAFVGQQKRDYADEKYFELTGRHKKKHQVPLPIVRGIKKAQAKREERERQEAKEAGVVLAKKPSDKAAKNRKSYDKTYDKFGPAPSIGFTKKGVFRVDSKSNQSKRSRR
jgi:ribosome biogenesis protein NSA1